MWYFDGDIRNENLFTNPKTFLNGKSVIMYY